jgi:hypothetical protein
VLLFQLDNALMISVHPEHVPSKALGTVNTLMADEQ